MDQLESVISQVTDVLWGPVMLVFLLGGGIYLSVRIGFIQIKHFRFMWSQTVGSLFTKAQDRNKSKGTITPFQAVTAELGSTVGASNIIGVSVALFFGGPGALFWMWATAFVGMATKYSEIVLSLLYREKNKDGEFVGGPMYYLRKGMGSKFLAVCFAFFFMIEIFSSIMVQSNSAAGSASSLGLPPIISGLIISAVIALIVFGGVKRVGKVSERFVPFMSSLYLLGAMVIILSHIESIPSIFWLVFKEAFHFRSFAGGLAGTSILMALRWGTARGLYSNEAGMGSAPIAHAAAVTDHPARQGLWGIFSVFFDTLIVGTVSGLVLLTTGIWKASGMDASEMPARAFTEFYGPLGGVLVSLSLLFFVISTIYVIAFYGEKLASFLFGFKFSIVMRLVYIGACFIGAVGGLKVVWLFLDLFLALVVVPNLIGVLGLSSQVVDQTKDFFDTKKKTGLKKK
ncbi:MAG: amino acid carrier protein [Candidatus Aminicenantes bacterium]|nr:amino acid carrier protein [Candidatus Aminicenantes bacterium]